MTVEFTHTPAIRTISNRIRSRHAVLADEFGVLSLGLFGSYLRGEANAESDLDLLVEYQETPTLLKFVRLQRYLSELLETPVDLVMKSALKPKIGERILAEVIPVWRNDSKKTTSTV
ncbi:MAG: nucleotidyltransferase family protein [Caldilineaceae bacterium]